MNFTEKCHRYMVREEIERASPFNTFLLGKAEQESGIGGLTPPNTTLRGGSKGRSPFNAHLFARLCRANRISWGLLFDANFDRLSVPAQEPTPPYGVPMTKKCKKHIELRMQDIVKYDAHSHESLKILQKITEKR